MGKLQVLVYAALIMLTLAGCGSSGGESPTVTMPPPPPPPEPTNFTTFVNDQFAATSDTTDPEPVDGEDFAFPDEENPGAFDNLLQ